MGEKEAVLTCLCSAMSTLFPVMANTTLGGPSCRSSCIQLCISLKLFCDERGKKEEEEEEEEEEMRR